MTTITKPRAPAKPNPAAQKLNPFTKEYAAAVYAQRNEQCAQATGR